jgi:hypothetical protein
MTMSYTTDQTAGQQRHNGHLGPADGEGVQDLELSEAEKQAVEAAGEYVSVPVNGIETRVKPQRDWRMSDMRFLREGDIDGWAESVIHPADIDAFMDLDITMDEFREFSEEAARRSGDGLGKSSGRSRSSRPTRRR